MTKNLKLFALFSLVTSIIFFAILDWMLKAPKSRGLIMGIVYIRFAAGFSFMGRYLGKRDDQRSVRYSLRIRYGTVAPLIATIVGAAWILIWHRQYLVALVIYLAVIIVCLAVMATFSKVGIKGTPKSKMFQ
jgi:hypothetical protein